MEDTIPSEASLEELTEKLSIDAVNEITRRDGCVSSDSDEEDEFGETEGDEVKERKRLRKIRRLVGRMTDGTLHGTSRNYKQLNVTVCHINVYGKDDFANPTGWVPSEICLCNFNLETGIKESEKFYAAVRPKDYPVAMRSDFVEACESLLFPLLGETDRYVPNSMEPEKLLPALEDWLEKNACKSKGAYIVFVKDDRVPAANACVDYLKKVAEVPAKCGIQFLPLSAILLALHIRIAGHDAFGFTSATEYMFEPIIKHSKYMYAHELGCEWHEQRENREVVDKCCQNVVFRYIYNCLMYLLLRMKVSPNDIKKFMPQLEDIVLFDERDFKKFNRPGNLEEARQYLEYCRSSKNKNPLKGVAGKVNPERRQL